MSVDGWGGGLSAVASGVPAAQQPSVRASAWRLVALAESCGQLDSRLAVDFSIADKADPYAQAARLTLLLRQLTELELPRLRRVVRCETRSIERRAKTPGGGRIDIDRTWRRRKQAGDRALTLRAIRRIAHTPVNQVLATRMTALMALLNRLDPLALLPEERRAAIRAREALRRFMAGSPLARVPPLGPADLPRVRRAAMRRRAEWRRVRSFLDWWARLADIEVGALYSADKTDRLPPGAAFELSVCAGLIAAWHDAVLKGRQAPAGLKLAARQTRHGRWAVRVTTDTNHLVIHARDLQIGAARDLLGFLDSRHILVVPGQIPTTDGLIAIAPERLVSLDAWVPIIDTLDSLLEAS